MAESPILKSLVQASEEPQEARLGNEQHWRVAYSPEDSRWSIIERHSGKPEITDLQLAICIGEDIFGLQVPVEHIGCSQSQKKVRHRSKRSKEDKMQKMLEQSDQPEWMYFKALRS